jgi:hypothetical protein
MAHATTEYLVSPLFYNNPWIRFVGNSALEELNLYFNTDKQYKTYARFSLALLYYFFQLVLLK